MARISVTLEIIQDKVLGLTVNVYSWSEGNRLQKRMEIANRYANDGSFMPYHVLAWDEEIDAPLAELKRKALEMSLNCPSPPENN